MRGCKLLRRVHFRRSSFAFYRLMRKRAVMNVLRMVKLFGWENKIEEKIKEKRAGLSSTISSLKAERMILGLI